MPDALKLLTNACRLTPNPTRFCVIRCTQTLTQKRSCFGAAEAGVELSRCAEPKRGSVECLSLIESAKLKKDRTDHHNDKGISMIYVQIKPNNQFRIALQPRASFKKKQIPIA